MGFASVCLGCGIRFAGHGILDAWTLAAVPVCAVSNEVGMGVAPDTSSGRLFRDELGKLNTRIAAISDNVLFVIAGIPQILKGSL